MYIFGGIAMDILNGVLVCLSLVSFGGFEVS
jgi:hypothetical protein